MDNENIYDAAYKEAHTIEYVETKIILRKNRRKKIKKEMEMDLQSILQ